MSSSSTEVISSRVFPELSFVEVTLVSILTVSGNSSKLATYTEGNIKVSGDTLLVGKVVNIASRCAKFINTKFDHKLSAECAEPELVQSFIDRRSTGYSHDSSTFRLTLLFVKENMG